RMRDSIEAQRSAAELDYTDLALQAGQHHELLARLSSRVQDHPLDERLAAQFMLALYRCGQQAKALSHYQETRQLLVMELGTEPSPPLQELHQRILEADVDLVAGSGGIAAPVATVPRQLPAPPGFFTGRTGELARLDRMLDEPEDRNRVVVVAISGGGGVGKTWLALRWAHSHANEFHDGQLYVNLCGFDPTGTPVEPGHALRGFLTALGVVPADIPADVTDQASLYRSLTARKRMLVVLDNARDTAHVQHLLPGSPTCTVLVTSRDHLAGLVVSHGAQPMLLDVLPHDDARALLTSRLDATRLVEEPDAVASILDSCSGLPLALGVVAGRAAMLHRLPLEVLALELREAATRLGALELGDADTGVRAVLSSSYAALAPEQAELFRLLCLAPGPDIGVPAVAVLSGRTAAKVRAVLRMLEEVSLVGQYTFGRYRMHDLIRLFGRERAASNDAGPAVRRLVDFYLHTAHAADRVLDPHSPAIELGPPVGGAVPEPLATEAAALAWLDNEHANLLAVQRWAAEQGQHAAVWQIAWALTTFHLRRGHLNDDILAWHAGLVAAQHLSDQRTEALAHRMLGDTHARLGDHAAAFGHLGQALSLAEEADDISGHAHAHTALSHAWATQGDEKEALRHAALALPLYRALDNSVWEARTLNQMGRLAANLGSTEQAIRHCEAALALSRRHSDRHGEADALASLGFIAHHSGEHSNAVHYDHQSLTLYGDLGDRYNEAATLEHLGRVHSALNRHDQARQTWHQALELYHAQRRTSEAQRVRHLIAAWWHST
ncbi:MAG: BTAD domain-containing putative transcriptional regulator, partial [Kibdelosporangium sp.]